MSALNRRLLQTSATLLIPLIIVLGIIRLLTTDAYLTFEYGRPGFPVDTYGFTAQQRFILASTNVHYVRAHLPDDELSKQTLNGKPVYNDREIAHMADVQSVFQIALRVWQLAFILFVLCLLMLWKQGEQAALFSALRLGGVLTSGVILLLGILAVVAWQAWFEVFHRLFFQPGSWRFSYADTLIRLFPNQFWFDTSLSLFILSFMGGLLLAFMGSRWRNINIDLPRDDVLASAH